MTDGLRVIRPVIRNTTSAEDHSTPVGGTALSMLRFTCGGAVSM